jgi:hypothetical protein
MSKLVVGAAIVAALVFQEYVRIVAENHPWRVGILLAVAAAIGAGIWLLSSSRAWPMAAGILLVAVGYGLVAGVDARDHELGHYCRYGAKSQAQLDGCMSHVTTDDIDKLHTRAADFARGWTSECAAGSGPYCAEAARTNAD